VPSIASHFAAFTSHLASHGPSPASAPGVAPRQSLSIALGIARRFALCFATCIAACVAPATRPASLFDMTGRHKGNLQPGLNDLSNLPGGVYFVRRAGEQRSLKVVILR
jgi:hypothetical protein